MPRSDHNELERTQAATRSTLVSVGVNLVLSLLQLAIGIFAKSQALIADSIHSLSDLVSDGIVLFANKHQMPNTPMAIIALKPQLP